MSKRIERTITFTDTILNRVELAAHFDVSLPTIDSWVSRDCPYLKRGSQGVEWAFSLHDVFAWYKNELLLGPVPREYCRPR